MLRMFVHVFSFCELVIHSLRSSGPVTQVYGYCKMLFQQVIDQHKKNMARICNLYRERFRSIKTVLFLIIVSVSLSSGQTVPTKWWPWQNKNMTTTLATVKNREKRIETKWKYCSWREKIQTTLLEARCWNQFEDFASLWRTNLRNAKK